MYSGLYGAKHTKRVCLGSEKIYKWSHVFNGYAYLLEFSVHYSVWLNIVGGKFQGGMEGGIRVPTVARLPGVIKAGVTVDVPTSQMDLLPTVAELLGLELPRERQIDGVSLLPLLQQQKVQDGRVLVHYCGEKIHAVRYTPTQGR